MNDSDASAVFRVTTVLLRELVDGAQKEAAWILNGGDPGLLRSLDRLSAEQASAPAPTGGPSIAAHVDHLCYGIGLLNRWTRGENPFADADYSASWERLTVSAEEWEALRHRLRTEAQQWIDAVSRLETLGDFELTGVIASAAHLAYHMGAIRQIDRTTRGPAARD